MRNVLWLIPLLAVTACHTQTPQPQIVTSARGTYVLLHPFTIIAVEQPQSVRVRCTDKEAQKSFRDMQDLSEMIYAGRMLQPLEFYGISSSECACEGLTGYAFEYRHPEVVVHCTNGG